MEIARHRPPMSASEAAGVRGAAMYAASVQTGTRSRVAIAAALAKAADTAEASVHDLEQRIGQPQDQPVTQATATNDITYWTAYAATLRREARFWLR